MTRKTISNTAKVILAIIITPFIAMLVARYLLVPLLPAKSLPTNGFVTSKELRYIVIVEDQEIEVTRDQYYYTPIGQWINFESAKGDRK